MSLEKTSVDKVRLFNIWIDCISMPDLVMRIDGAISSNENILHSVVNAGKIVLMQRDKELYDSVCSADIITADGQAVVWASKMLGARLPERVTGIDLMYELVKLAHDKKYKIFFFGAKEDVVKEVQKRFTTMYSSDIVAGYRNGYYQDGEEDSIAEQINISGADILFIAISSPKKEIFLSKYKRELEKVSFTMGVGGSFDVVAGKTRRAPKWMQQTGLEWFYRFIQEPRRMWRRYLVGNTKFILLVLAELLWGKSSK